MSVILYKICTYTCIALYVFLYASTPPSHDERTIDIVELNAVNRY